MVVRPRRSQVLKDNFSKAPVRPTAAAAGPTSSAAAARQPPASPQVMGAEVVPGSNRVKLKLSRPKPAAAVGAAVSEGWPANGLAGEAHASGRPRRQVRAPSRFSALGNDDEHALQPLEAYSQGPPGAPGVCGVGGCILPICIPSAARATSVGPSPPFLPFLSIAGVAVSCERALRSHPTPPRPTPRYLPLQPGRPRQPAAGVQPFRVRVAPAAELMMDCHAHLSTNEVRQAVQCLQGRGD